MSPYATVRPFTLCLLAIFTVSASSWLQAASPDAFSASMSGKIPGIVLPAQRATISAASSGIVSSLAVEEGDAADTGALLVQLDDRSEQLTVDRYQQILKKRRYDHDSSQQLFKDDIISEGQALEREIELAVAELDLQQAKLNQALKAIVAPFDGMVASTDVEPGEWLEEGEPVMEFININELIIRIVVAPGLANSLTPGDTFAVYRQANAPSPFRDARITFIDPIIDAESGLRRIHLSMSNVAETTSPDQFAMTSGMRVFVARSPGQATEPAQP